MQELLNKIIDFFKQPRALLIGIVITLLLYLPSLWVGLLIDDYYQYGWINSPELINQSDKPSLFGLFSFVDDDPVRRQQLLNNALIPWWTEDAFGFNFFRPVSELTHWFDYTVLNEWVPLMHAHSLLWMCLCSLLMYAVYKRLFKSSGIAMLAFLLFSLDSTHTLTVIWLSNRNAVLSCLFGMLMFLFYMQGKEDGSPYRLTLALLAFVASLWSGEIGVSAFFYLCSYILIIERSTLVDKVRSAMPFGLLLALYLVFYKLYGFGASGNTAKYLDPFSEPMAFFVGAFSRIPMMLVSQFGLLISDMSFAITRELWQWPLVLTGFLAFFVFVFYPMYRKDRLPVFFLLGTVLSTLPIIAGTPSDRNLFLTGVGGSGLIASCLNYWWINRGTIIGLRGVLVSVTAWSLIVMHLLVSPVLVALMSYLMIDASRQSVDFASNIPGDINLEGKQVAFVHVPFAAAALFVPVRNWLELPLPEQSWWITEIGRPVHMRRVDAHTLSISMDKGLIEGHSEQLFRLPSRVPFHLGDKVQMEGLAIEVVKVSEQGQAQEIHATFTRQLGDPDLVFFSYIDEKLRLQEIPGAGQTITIDAPDPIKKDD